MNRLYSSRTVSMMALLSILVTTVAFYYLPLSSPFVFDDFYNLAGLNEINDKGYLYYIFNSGFSGPSGRPVSLFSFALQHDSWPSNPFPFKAVNLIIHLLNGILIWFICEQILCRLEIRTFHKKLLVILTTAIWLLHPIHLTTVLYTVQRMTQLSSLFSLVGLLCYLHARQHVVIKESLSSYILLGTALVAPMILGVLCKENAILIMLLVLVLELTIFQNVTKPRYWNKWAAIVIGIPVSVLVLYLAVKFSFTLKTFHFRDFTMAERLLTQPVVLLTYLKNIIIPTYGAFTLFHDDFTVSRGLFDPFYTFVCLFAVLSLIVFSIWKRKAYPVLSFAILWFFSAHLLESTFLNLELYFEHRNYLPSIAICFAIAAALVWVFKKIRSPYIATAMTSLYVFLIITVLFLEADLWHKPALQASEWSRLHPESVRSLNKLANIYLTMGEYERALEIFDQIEKVSPDILLPILQKQRIVNCRQPFLNTADNWDIAIKKASTARPNSLEIVALLDLIMVETLKGDCRDGTLSAIDDLLYVLLENRQYVFIKDYIFEFLAITAVQKRNYNNALEYIDESIRIKPRAEKMVFRLRILELMNRTDLIEQMLKKMEEEAGMNPVKRLTLKEIIDAYNNK